MRLEKGSHALKSILTLGKIKRVKKKDEEVRKERFGPGTSKFGRNESNAAVACESTSTRGCRLSIFPLSSPSLPFIPCLFCTLPLNPFQPLDHSLSFFAPADYLSSIYHSAPRPLKIRHKPRDPRALTKPYIEASTSVFPTADMQADRNCSSTASSTNNDPSATVGTAANPSSQDPPPHFAPEEEAALLASSHDLKAAANKQFASSDYSSAISSYDRALAECPNYLDYEIAVLKSNIAACHLKLEDWKAAIESANAALDCLERLLPTPKKKEKTKDEEGEAKNVNGGTLPEENDTPTHKAHATTNDTPPTNNPPVIELDASDPETEAAQLRKLQLSDAHHTSIQRIRQKSLLRRARAKSSLGGWANLQAAEDDYRDLATHASSSLPPADRKVVQAALRELPARVQEAREREMGEMMGKLKELGNGLLRPFGLSTDMFKMQGDGKGGYSLSTG